MSLFAISAVILIGCFMLGANSQPEIPSSPEPKVAAAAPNLHEAFAGDFEIGAALGGQTLSGSDSTAMPLVATQFNSFTGENCMKPQPIQPEEGVFRFEEADNLMKIARESGANVVGHTLVWHSQTPGWFFKDADGKPVSRELALKRMRTHIAAVVGRYKGQIKQWDVVNEAISDNGSEWLRPSPWLKAIGEDYIAEAFRAAHAADPDALLLYNDYNIENPGKREKTIKLLKSLKEQGVPIHGVGIQGHWGLGYPSLETIETAIQEFGKLGLKVMITELDVSVLPAKYFGADVSVQQMKEEGLDPYTEGLPAEVAQQQAERYRALFEVFLRNRDIVDRVTFWGVHDGQSWKNNFPIRGRTDYALLFDRQGKPKPAFNELVKLADSKKK